MGISDRHFESRLTYAGRVNPLIVLIAVSMVVFVVLAFFKALTYVSMPQGSDVIGAFDKKILGWAALSDDPKRLLTRPWTLLTYAFTHTSIWSLLGSMIWLWAFGYILIDLTGFKKIVPVFLYGALAGAIGFLLFSNLMPAKTTIVSPFILGSGTGILAICAAATFISPKYKIFPMMSGGIPLWILSIVYLTIDLATLPPGNPALYVAHLAGALAGILFILILRKGMDGSDWMNNMYDWFYNLFNPEKKHQSRSKIKATLFYNSTSNPYTKTPKITQQRLDEILDKINQKGYDHLSSEEKEFLKRASEEDMKDK